jgi:ADP-heptose:LPS heptosyltransferase
VKASLTEASIADFVAVLAQADVLFCGDTLAVHIATAIRLPTVCIFGPTSLPEIADFNGLIIKTAADSLECLGCYADCTKVQNCMSLINVSQLIELTVTQLDLHSKAPASSLCP